MGKMKRTYAMLQNRRICVASFKLLFGTVIIDNLVGNSRQDIWLLTMHSRYLSVNWAQGFPSDSHAMKLDQSFCVFCLQGVSLWSWNETLATRAVSAISTNSLSLQETHTLVVLFYIHAICVQSQDFGIATPHRDHWEAVFVLLFSVGMDGRLPRFL